MNFLELDEEGLRASAIMLIELVIRTESGRTVVVLWLLGLDKSRACILGISRLGHIKPIDRYNWLILRSAA